MAYASNIRSFEIAGEDFFEKSGVCHCLNLLACHASFRRMLFEEIQREATYRSEILRSISL